MDSRSPAAEPPGIRAGLCASLAALATTLPALTQPGEAAEAAESIQRIARSLRTSGALEGRPELAEQAEAVLAADSRGIREAAARLMDGLAAVARRSADADGDLVLLIQDDERLGQAIESALHAAGRRVIRVPTAAAAWELLRRQAAGLIVLDLILPDGDGRNVLLEIRSDPRTAAIPVFVISARFGSRPRAECFALGAESYLEKPFDLEAFAVQVSASMSRHANQAALARRDPVTGLPNRAAFLEGWVGYRGAQPPDTRFALAILNLDHFQWLEDTWGRRYAESTLRRAGVRLAMTLRKSSLLARWDGAEFIALFAGQTARAAGAIVEDALRGFRKVDFGSGTGQPLNITFSAGVVDITPGQSFEEAIAQADRTLYVAKASGRNRVVAGDAESIVPVQRVLLAEDDAAMVRLLTRHLGREGFEVLAFPNGAAALAGAPASGAALVVSDIEMPELDGLSLLGELRAHPEFRHTPIMMLTAMGDESDVVRAFELGADDYVLKPFSIREVTARIRRLLRRPCVAGVPIAS